MDIMLFVYLIFSWQYLDINGDFWWHRLQNKKFFVIDTLDKTYTLLFQYNFSLCNSLIEETQIDTDYGVAI